MRDPFALDREALPVEQKELLEADIQKQCIAYAKRCDYWARKFSSQSQRSVPDYLFSRQRFTRGAGPKFAVEFKRPGEVSTEKQWLEQYDMWLHGWDVYECNSLEKFKRIVAHVERGGTCIRFT